MPFHLRWLLPYLCRQNERLWDLISGVFLILIPILSYIYFLQTGLTENQSIFGGALVCGLPGVILINYIGKYLSDGFGICMMLASIISFQDYWYLGIIFSVIGSMANEKCFVYASLITFNPLALIGGVAVLLRYLLFKPAKSDKWGGDEIIKNPLSSGIQSKKGKLLSYEYFLAWGLYFLVAWCLGF